MYIAFEGGEGSGKSTQARLLAERLDAVLTREPGGTPLGARLRELLLNTDDGPDGIAIGARAEALMMAADRAQHIDEVIRPALAAGRHVVSDRTAFSSMAYQGGGRDLGIEAIGRLSDWAIDRQWPDVVVFLKVTPVQAAARIDRSLDRIEQAGHDFHQRVSAAFEEMAAAEPERWVVVDGNGPVGEVAEAVWRSVQPWLAG
ncbi:MAG: dTMP kinase [Acidimicrobiia bacterium]|nr:dTMP kinase [Acidimicrobiia bacterium]